MDPPSYDEANLHPPPLSTVALNISPPPTYDASIASPSTPPPTYGEAVSPQLDPFPALIMPPAVTSPQQQAGYIIHSSTQNGIIERVQSRPTQAAVVVQPQPLSVTDLGDTPGVIRCPYCHQVVTTKVMYMPGKAAWCMCMLLTLVGLICGCCLIPFMVQGMQDAHHSCPQCNNHLHIYTR